MAKGKYPIIRPLDSEGANSEIKIGTAHEIQPTPRPTITLQIANVVKLCAKKVFPPTPRRDTIEAARSNRRMPTLLDKALAVKLLNIAPDMNVAPTNDGGNAPQESPEQSKRFRTGNESLSPQELLANAGPMTPV